MLQRLRSLFSGKWFKLSEVPDGLFGPGRGDAVLSTDEALTISPFYCGIRLYQSVLASLPFITYRADDDGGRERATDHPAYKLLNLRPNPGMSRSVFFELLALRYFCDGEFFAHVGRDQAGRLTGLYPVAKSDVVNVIYGEDWTKAYMVRTVNGIETYVGREMMQIVGFSHDGLRGIPVWEHAGESLGLHRRVIEGAEAYYRNSVRPSGYLKFPGKLTKDNLTEVKDYFKAEYAGAANTGKMPVLMNGGEFERFPGGSAEEQKIIEALGASVDDVARWLNVSPLQLFNFARGTYSNLGADNGALYQRSMRPITEKVEQEADWAIFSDEPDYYARFLASAILRGDPQQQATVANIGIQNGSLTRAEQREFLDLPYIPGTETPLQPLNMVAVSKDGTEPNPDPA
ncbi:MAG: phage portal protein [Fimbriiglobus sp.]